MASSITVPRLAAAEVSLGSSLADNDKGYYEQDYEQQYNRITGHNSSDVSHSAKLHSTNKVEEEDDDEDGGLNIISPSCNEDEDDSEDEDEDETTKTTIERRRKKQPCHRNVSLNRSLISIIKPRRTKPQHIMDTSILRGQEANFYSLFDSVVLEMDTRKVRRVDFSTRLEIYFFE